MPSNTLSDKAIAVFAFAAYHQLSSGETVVDVVLHDGAGHAADPEAIKELERSDLAKVDIRSRPLHRQGQGDPRGNDRGATNGSLMGPATAHSGCYPVLVEGARPGRGRFIGVVSDTLLNLATRSDSVGT